MPGRSQSRRLAAGKGVIVCKRRDDALDAIDRISRSASSVKAGTQMIIEERLDGPEASVLAITMVVPFFHCHRLKITSQPLMAIPVRTLAAWELTAHADGG